MSNHPNKTKYKARLAEKTCGWSARKSRLLNATGSSVIVTLVLFTGFLTPVTSAAQDASLLQPYQRFEAAAARGDFAAAAAQGRLALELAEQQYGTESAEIVGTLEMLGKVMVALGDYDAAILFYRRIVRIKEREYGIKHPDLIPTLDAMVDVHWRQSDFPAAEALLQRILEIERSVYGDSHADVVITLNRLRDLYISTDRTQDLARIETTLQALSISTRDLELLEPGDPQSLESRRYSTADGFATIRVFYGTNRARSGEAKAAQFYGADRGELEVGYLDVSIPAIHKYGELETSSRWSIFTYGLGEDALKEKYVLLLNVEPLEGRTFYEYLNENIRNSPSSDIFMFVHGYNSSFEDAARRTAQLAYDLDFDGTPMMYSWPSQGSTTSYTVDEAVVRVSGKKMADFLIDIVQQAGADRIHLIAHSMGNRALIQALEKIASKQNASEPTQIFDQVVFTAPDVDRDYFIDSLADIRPLARRVTLYASENDRALQTSAVLHGAPRAGLAGDAMIVADGLDTIDMSAVEADSLGHSYFAANEGAIYDLFRLLWLGEPPEQRCGMHEQARQTSNSWLFNVDVCKGGEVLEAGLLFKRFGQNARERISRRLTELTDKSDAAAKDEWLAILDRFDQLLEKDGS
jgi:esterase/lipase superfamily enzyme